jgi:hypothetical protein
MPNTAALNVLNNILRGGLPDAQPNPECTLSPQMKLITRRKWKGTGTLAWTPHAASRRTPFFVVLCRCQAKRKGAQSCTESFSFEKH